MNLCRKCGRCCWDWKGGNPADRCEHLAADMITCLVHDDPEAPGACDSLTDNWPEPRHACDLPPDCGFVVYWREQGLL
jgi:hypothetical protein